MGKRLIYAEDAIKEIIKKLGIRDESYLTAQEKAVVQVLKDMPSAQPEIIRCKDCRHRRDVVVCPMTDISLNVSYAQDDYYCSFAERRTDE